MPWGSWINDLPTEFFLVVHIAAFAIGAGFAWLAFKRELTLLGSAFSLFAVALTVQPASGLALAGAVAVFVGLLVSYAFATTTGLFVLHPEPQPVDVLALATKAIEAFGLLAASRLMRRGRPAVPATLPQPKGT
jgi:hypothetical protein